MSHGRATKLRIRSVPALYSTSSHLLPSVLPVRGAQHNLPTSQRGIQRYSKSLSQRLRYEFISVSYLRHESLSHSLTGLLCSLSARGWGSVWGFLGQKRWARGLKG